VTLHLSKNKEEPAKKPGNTKKGQHLQNFSLETSLESMGLQKE